MSLATVVLERLFDGLVMLLFVFVTLPFAPLPAGYDVLVHPSAHESQGSALVEAALAEVPIAGFDVGVAGELARLGAVVELARSADAGSLAEAVIASASRVADPAARARVAARFGLAASAEAFVRVLEEAKR